MRRLWPALRSVFTWFFAVLLILVIVALRGYLQNSWFPPRPWEAQIHDDFWSYFIATIQSPMQIFSESQSDHLDRIVRHMPLNVLYIVLSFVLAYLLGVLKGLADVFWKHHMGYRLIQKITWLVDALPMFGVLAIVELGSLFAYMHFKSRDPIYFFQGNNFWESDFLLSCILMFSPMMYISRLIRITVEQEMGEQYVLTARSKGLTNRQVFYQHIFKNCLPKLLNEASTVFTMILSSLLILEYLSFRWGGALDMFVAMGHKQLGDTGSIMQNPGSFDLALVVDYLLIFATITLLFQVVAFLLKRRWQVTLDA
jgi:ABC-type dipeptide/oligopeptide/nickel transport system permease component